MSPADQTQTESAELRTRTDLHGASTPEAVGRRQRRIPVLPIAVAALLIAAWEVIGQAADFLYLPPLSEIMSALVDMTRDGTIPKELVASLTALGVGMAISVLAGMAIGLLMGISSIARRALDVYIDALMTAPVVAFVPLFIMLFGLGFETRVATVILFAIFPVIINTMAGVREVDPALILMGRSFGARGWTAFWTIRLPMAYPHVQAGLRASAARGVDGVITGEVLIAAVGLGGMISRYGNAFAMPRLYATVIVIVVLVLVASRVIDLVGLVVPRRPRRT